MLETDVVIVGAGVSGLAAARLLGRFGVPCVLVEAGERIGGRLLTVRRPGWQLPIELGAEFVHGRPAPTLALGGGSVNLVHVAERRMRAGRFREPMPDVWQRFAQALAPALEAPEEESVAAFLARSTLDESERELVRMIVEGYHAAPVNEASARAAAQDAAAAGFVQYRTSTGYDGVLAELERGLSHGPCRIELNKKVRQLRWEPGRVELRLEAAAGEQRLRARSCIVTTSIAVLGSSSIEISPRPASFDALAQLGMGQALRVVLRFEELPWVPSPGRDEPTFVHVPEAQFDTLWREARAGQQQITAWAGGPKAAELSALDPAERIREALASLALAVGLSPAACRQALLEAHHHDFIRDELFRGAYTFAKAGAGDAARRLAQPCESTLFFAGEALDVQYPGTVAGALGSGERAARQVLASRNH